MNELKEEIEEARVRVAHYRGKAERPGSRLEDEFALEKARNRLLTLELKLLKLAQGQHIRKPQQSSSDYAGARRQDALGKGRVAVERKFGTKRKQVVVSARQKAEADFAELQSKEPSGVANPAGQEVS